MRSKAARENFQDLLWALINYQRIPRSTIRRMRSTKAHGSIISRQLTGDCVARRWRCSACWLGRGVVAARPIGRPAGAPAADHRRRWAARSGSQVEVTITGENLDDAEELIFSDPPHHREAQARRRAASPSRIKYVVTIAADCPVGLYEARVMTRLGISSSRASPWARSPKWCRRSPNTDAGDRAGTAAEFRLQRRHRAAGGRSLRLPGQKGPAGGRRLCDARHRFQAGRRA